MAGIDVLLRARQAATGRLETGFNADLHII